MVAPAAAVAELGDWRPDAPGQEALRQAFLAFLAARPADACARSCEPGHLTASALLLDHAGERTLLTLHPRAGVWCQLGGHCEAGDPTLCAAALREATEESGIAGLAIDATPLHLDVHPITCSLGLPTRHLDVRYLVRAPADTVERISDESDDLRWWSLDALPPEDTLTEMVAVARHRIAGAATSAARSSPWNG